MTMFSHEDCISFSEETRLYAIEDLLKNIIKDATIKQLTAELNLISPAQETTQNTKQKDDFK